MRVHRSVFCAFLVLAIPAASAQGLGPEWTEVGSADDRDVLVDFSRLRRTTNGASGWYAHVAKRSRAAAFDASERHGLTSRDIRATGRIVRALVRFEVECQNEQFKTLAAVSYNAAGEVVTSYNFDYPEWIFVVPGSLGEVTMRAACEWRDPPQYEDPAPPPPPPPPPPRTSEVREFSEVQPVLIGGIEALQSRIVYPDWERRAGVEGIVIVGFTVGTGGAPYNIEIVRAVSPGLDLAAIQAVQLTRFTPGLQDGRPVDVLFTLPVTFRIK